MAADAIEELFPDGLAGKHIHGIGAGGSGLSAMLWLARDRGAVVSGCDIAPTSMWKLLSNEGFDVRLGHNPDHLDGVDLVVISPFLTFRHPDLPELVAARERGIPVLKWQAVLGSLMSGSIGVSVAGVHGKGSTTALLGHILQQAGLDPTCEVGATAISWGRNVLLGHGRYFVNEADEFDYNFLHYHPRVVVLTAVEYDHPEFFGSYEAIRDAFVTFLRGMDVSPDAGHMPPPTLVVNVDSPGCLDVLRQLGEWPGTVHTFGISSRDAETRALDAVDGPEASFTFVSGDRSLGRVAIATPGRHNIYNALAAGACALALGVPDDVIVPAIASWRGLHRRFEVIADGDVIFIDDYAHHPHAVALTIDTARECFPGRRIVGVFQPTLYTRLARFLQPFAEALAHADAAVVVEIQPSREEDTGLIHGNDLVAAIRATPEFATKADAAVYGGTFDETAQMLRAMRQPGDVIVVMGSGPVNQVIGAARLS